MTAGATQSVIGGSAQARKLAENYLTQLQLNPPMELVILDQHTIESDFGWVVFWNSRQYAETGDFMYALAGNGPLIVDRGDGSIHEIPSAQPIEAALARYRQERTQALRIELRSRCLRHRLKVTTEQGYFCLRGCQRYIRLSRAKTPTAESSERAGGGIIGVHIETICSGGRNAKLGGITPRTVYA
jgi:hypothetical protein